MNALMKVNEHCVDPYGIGQPTILLIDDDPDLLAALSDMLKIRLRSVRIDTCQGSSFAVSMVQQRAYDLILCDVSMPGINGLELLPKLRKAAPHASIFMMSAAFDRGTQTRALANGATAFLAKPFDRDSLTLMLMQTLQDIRVSLTPSATSTTV